MAHVSIHPFYPVLLVDSEIVTYTCQLCLLDMTASITDPTMTSLDLFVLLQFMGLHMHDNIAFDFSFFLTSLIVREMYYLGTSYQV